jgi:B-cell receptor-associated protein 31
MRKYSNEEYDLTVNPKAEMQAHMKLFRAQRNFYISGFALMFSLIIRRIMSLLTTQATLMAQSEASMRQATSASDAARRLMKEQGDSKDKPSSSNTAADKEANAVKAQLQTEVNTLKEELEKLKKDRDAVKTQAANLAKEYDRVCDENAKLQKSSGSGGKKDD